MAFNGAGNLFVGYGGSGAGQGGVVEITPGGGITTIATGLYGPNYLAFNTAGDLFVADDGSGNVVEITPGGSESTFASGLGNATGLAFQGIALPVPEPSDVAMILGGLAAVGLFIRRRAG
jgi:hypothetical protein